MFILAHDTVDCNTFMPLPFYPSGLFPFVFPLFLSMLYTQKAPAVSDRSFPLTGYVYEFGNIFFISDILSIHPVLSFSFRLQLMQGRFLRTSWSVLLLQWSGQSLEVLPLGFHHHQ